MACPPGAGDQPRRRFAEGWTAVLRRLSRVRSTSELLLQVGDARSPGAHQAAAGLLQHRRSSGSWVDFPGFPFTPPADLRSPAFTSQVTSAALAVDKGFDTRSTSTEGDYLGLFASIIPAADPSSSRLGDHSLHQTGNSSGGCHAGQTSWSNWLLGWWPQGFGGWFQLLAVIFSGPRAMGLHAAALG